MYTKRRNTVFKQMNEHAFACFFSGIAPSKSADQVFPFEVNRNFYYLTGIDQEDVVLVMFKGSGYEKSFLFVEPIDPVQALWVGEGLTKAQAKDISGVDEVIDRNLLDATLSKYLQDSRAAIFGELKHLYLDLERRDIKHPHTISNQFASRMQDLYPNLVVNNLHPFLGEQRSVKVDAEVHLIKEALEITKAGIETLMREAKPGMREYSLEAYYNFVLNINGVTPSFNTIAASGKNATILHYEKNNAIIQDNDLILFDLGVKKDVYCSDITRTFPVNGKFTQRQKQIYEIVLEANKKSIEMLKPGVTFKAFNDFGRKILAEGLMRIGKISNEEEITQYYYHSLGHFLGLDVHDVGNYTKPFEVGQILTVEPGLYLADEGIGIRIEDNILLTEKGNINLSKDIIKEIDDIEAFMAKK